MDLWFIQRHHTPTACPKERVKRRRPDNAVNAVIVSLKVYKYPAQTDTGSGYEKKPAHAALQNLGWSTMTSREMLKRLFSYDHRYFDVLRKLHTYTYTHTCMCACTQPHMHVCTHTSTHTHKLTCTYEPAVALSIKPVFSPYTHKTIFFFLFMLHIYIHTSTYLI